MKVPKKKMATLLAHYAEDRAGHHGAVVPPLYQNSLFVFDEWDAIDAAFDDRFENPIYTRGTNPTVRMVEQKLAALAGGEAARLFASGMAAVTAAVMHFVDAGDHVIAVKNVYGPANNLLNRYLSRKMGLRTSFVSSESVEPFEAAIEDRTRLIYLESAPGEGDGPSRCPVSRCRGAPRRPAPATTRSSSRRVHREPRDGR